MVVAMFPRIGLAMAEFSRMPWPHCSDFAGEISSHCEAIYKESHAKESHAGQIASDLRG